MCLLNKGVTKQKSLANVGRLGIALSVHDANRTSVYISNVYISNV